MKGLKLSKNFDGLVTRDERYWLNHLGLTDLADIVAVPRQAIQHPVRWPRRRCRGWEAAEARMGWKI